MRQIVTSIVIVTAIFTLAERSQGEAAQQSDEGADTQLQDAEIQNLIRQLSDNDFKTRDAGQRRLLEIGEPAIKAIQLATQSKDPEIAARAKAILKAWARKVIDAAEVHVVGLYESRNGPAIVEVSATEKPVTLVLCAYEGVTWNVRLAKGAKLVHVIASGYHRQTVHGVDVPITTLSYDQRTPLYFYTYDHDEKKFPKMLAGVRKLTGKVPSSFQGRYSFRSAAFRVPFRLNQSP